MATCNMRQKLTRDKTMSQREMKRKRYSTITKLLYKIHSKKLVIARTVQVNCTSLVTSAYSSPTYKSSQIRSILVGFLSKTPTEKHRPIHHSSFKCPQLANLFSKTRFFRPNYSMQKVFVCGKRKIEPIVQVSE